MSESEYRATTNPRYVLYDFNTNALVTTQVFDSQSEAADIAEQLQDVLILRIFTPCMGEDASSAGVCQPA